MKTYKDIQDEVLNWMADAEDDGLLRTLVKQGINRTHTKLLTAAPYDFMIWPKTETLTIAANTTAYSLHPLFHQALYFYNPNTNEYMEEIPQRQVMESQEDWQDGTTGDPVRFSLTGLSHVLNQPASAGVVVVTPTGGNESASNTIIVAGMVGDDYREETLSSGSAWSSLTGSLSFSRIISISKTGSTWSRTITITAGSTTILTLLADEYGKQYRQLELLLTPTTATSILYRFFQKPRQLVNDYDIPQIPEEYSELLTLHTLLKMQGYSRATPQEVKLWQTEYDELMKEMRQNYLEPRSVGARPRYVTVIPRT